MKRFWVGVGKLIEFDGTVHHHVMQVFEVMAENFREGLREVREKYPPSPDRGYMIATVEKPEVCTCGRLA
jgi:hypothetical protein